MDFKKILVELGKNISKTYSAESLSTESAMTAIVASNATSLNEEDVKKVEKTLNPIASKFLNNRKVVSNG